MTFSPSDFRLLRVFQAVVQNKGFASAQSALGISPGTISNHIAQLEGRFGVRLCERGRKGFSLTPDGARIYDAAESLLRSAENFAGIIGSIRGEPTGTVHFGMVDAMLTNSAAPLHRAIARFKELAPKVILHVEIASPQDLQQRLLDSRYSVIITPMDRKQQHPSVTVEHLYREEQRLYCGRTHELFDSGVPLTAETLRSYPYVARTYMREVNQSYDDGFAHHALTAHMEAVAILINSGKYLGYLPVHFAKLFVDTGEMRSLLDEELAYFDMLYLARRKNEHNRLTDLLSNCLIGAVKAGELTS